MRAREILIIHLSRLGDTIQSLPAVKRLKEKEPGSRITYLGIEDFCTLLEGSPWIDRLVTVPWREIRGIMGENREGHADSLDRFLRRTSELGEGYDLLINLTHDWSSSYLSAAIKAEEKRGRIFSENDEIVVSGDWAKYLFAAARNRRDNLLNLVDIYMGMAGVSGSPVSAVLVTDPQQDLRCASLIKASASDHKGPVIGIQLGANMEVRRWPVENFVRLAEMLKGEFDASIVLFGSPSERGLAEDFQRMALFPVLDLVGKTTIEELPSFFRGIDLLVSNDTGPIHIAAAVGTRVVGIFMATAFFGITGPYGAGHVAVQSHYPCCPCIDTTICENSLCRESITPQVVLLGVRLALSPDGTESKFGIDTAIYRSSFGSDGAMGYEMINGGGNHFLSWLALFNHTKATVGQALWNRWLGLSKDSGGVMAEGMDRRIIADFEDACHSYRDIYYRGIAACSAILDEFAKRKPNLRLVQGMADLLSQGEEDIRNQEGPLGILKEIHEMRMSETRICDFPELAVQFRNTYSVMNETLTFLDEALQGIKVHM